MVVWSLLPHLLWGTTLHNYNYEVEFGITTEPTYFCAVWLSYEIRIYMFWNSQVFDITHSL